jgi:hypothetical protein
MPVEKQSPAPRVVEVSLERLFEVCQGEVDPFERLLEAVVRRVKQDERKVTRRRALTPREREFVLWLSELDRIDAGQRETLNELVLRARAAMAAAP